MKKKLFLQFTLFSMIFAFSFLKCGCTEDKEGNDSVEYNKFGIQEAKWSIWDAEPYF